MADTPVTIDPCQSVDALMRRRPETIGVFIANRMHCPGCAFAVFHSIGDACQEYDLPLESFLAALEVAIGSRDCTPKENDLKPIP